jgi:two-component system, OmpR family, response regulator
MVKLGESKLRDPLRILVVDDEPEVRDLLRWVLSREGFSVAEAANGLSALQLIEMGSFDLLITDIDLPPPLDGLETVRRARVLSRKLKSLFISGKSEPSWDDAEQDDFVSKPFRNSELVGCVWELLTRGIPDENEMGGQAELGILEAKMHCLSQLRDKAIADGDVAEIRALNLKLGNAKSEWARLTGNRRRTAH